MLVTNTFKFQFDLERTDTSQRVLAPWVNKLQFTIYNFFFFTKNYNFFTCVCYCVVLLPVIIEEG